MINFPTYFIQSFADGSFNAAYKEVDGRADKFGFPMSSTEQLRSDLLQIRTFTSNTIVQIGNLLKT